MRITVVGTGYVGLVGGVCLADSGNDVLCLDVDANKVARLAKGEVTIYEPGLSDLMHRSVREGRLTFTTDYDKAVSHSRVYFLCLPTPPAADFSADVRCVNDAASKIATMLAAADKGKSNVKPPLFVLKSTVPVGTNANIRKIVEKIYDKPFAVANNPEFLKEGTAVDDFMKPDRVVVGVVEDWAYDILHLLHEPFVRTGAPILRMDPTSAEITKYAANGFLSVKISFINEVARLCEATGADVEMVRRAISLDPRIGKTFLFPGLGYGGSCFPKDTRALVASARAAGLDFYTVDAAEKVNETQRTWLMKRISERFGKDLSGKTFGIWGLAFKPRTDDIREAPALAIIAKLLEAGAKVRVFDPEAAENVRRQLGDKIVYSENPYQAVDGADAMLLVTEWNEFRSPDWDRILTTMKSPVVFDGRNIFEPALLRKMGFEYFAIGRP